MEPKKAFITLYVIWCVVALSGLAAFFGLIYVIAHFIAKVW